MLWVACLVLLAEQVASNPITGSVYYKSGKWSYVIGTYDSSAVAYGQWDDSIPTIGWAKLQITTNSKFEDNQQAYGAGLLEGVFTQKRIWMHYNNLVEYKTVKDIPKPIAKYFNENSAFVNKTIRERASSDPYWHQASLMWSQYEGLVYGYQKAAINDEALEEIQLKILVSKGDMFDLRPALIKSERPDFDKMSHEELIHWMSYNLHCSASYKATDDFSDLFFGHTSWYTYAALTKLIKIYEFHYNHDSTTATTIHMSSYPGMLSSFDDFYLMSSGLNSIETSIGVFNHSLYDDYISPETLLYWMRVMIANRMASTPKQWCEIFKKYNSGTYNNQWMVLKVDNFTPKKALPAGSFYVLDQLPGPYVLYSDETDSINWGYYPSFNVPLHQESLNISGYTKYGMDYWTAVRADIFRRDEAKVKDLSSYQHLMTYNGYGKGDPLAKKPDDAISARGDLDGECGGGYDSKTTSYTLFMNHMTIQAQAGPTHQQPIFSFSNTTAKCPKGLMGLPDVWNFPFQTFQAN